MVSLSQRLSRSGALTSACLHVHVGRALLLSFPVALSVVMTSRALAQVKKSSVLCCTHTPQHFLSLVAERWVPDSENNCLTGPIPQSSLNRDQLKGFLLAMVTAHEADLLYMRNFLEEITKNEYNQGGLTLKDLKPDTFESNEKSKLSFRQWSDECSSWVERIDQDFEKLLRLAAQMQEWDNDKFITEAQQDYRLGAEKIAEFDKHIYLAMKRLTAGIAREIVDTSKSAGEAWYRLTDRFYGRNVQGATAIASQLQELKRPTQIAESFHLLNEFRKLVREFARQSPKEPMPSAIVKAAYMRVVPKTYRRAMETQVDVATSSSHGGSDSYPDLNNCEHAAQWGQDWNVGDADTSGSSEGELYGLHKGKCKGGSFNGICYNCGKSGHSAKFCYAKGGEAKGKGKKGDSKGWTVRKGMVRR